MFVYWHCKGGCKVQGSLVTVQKSGLEIKILEKMKNQKLEAVLNQVVGKTLCKNPLNMTDAEQHQFRLSSE